jgi:tetratricopeptide (TPR) repeat protein
MHFTKAVSTLCFLLFCMLCLQIAVAHAEAGHTVRGVVITTDGTAVPEFTVVVRHIADKPELVHRLHFKNGRFEIDGLTADKYQLGISASSYVSARLDFDFNSHSRPTNYSIVILHNYRNEARLAPGSSYKVSINRIREKIPDAALQAYRKGVELHREGKLEEALAEYGKALRAYPNFVEALSDLGTIFILYNRPESALVFLRRAQAIDNCNAITNLNVAIALSEQGDYGESAKLLRKILRDEPQMATAHFYLAKVLYRQKKYRDAEASAQQAVSLDSRLLDAWLLMVSINLDQKRVEQARDSLQHIQQSISDGKVTAFIDEQLSALGS